MTLRFNAHVPVPGGFVSRYVLLEEAGSAGHADGAGMGSHLGSALARLEYLSPRCEDIRRKRGIFRRSV